ncbi:MAG: tRNA uridine-5-carboxymethylaminomethyl(34) synthesis GTPase MnmE [Desulfarculus sp.]|nr:tRNA uridine-5-carboxymethylaminomethyl(34) synthesis GTPase MnmE [Desulfarculus sp.]
MTTGSTRICPAAGTPPDTITAVSTPGGQGGIGIVRISGPLAWAVGLALFRPSRPWPEPGRPPLRRLLHGHVIDPSVGEPVDEVLCAFFQAPHSYTTQDSVELQGHGGPAALMRVLELALGQGCRLARPGEFTLRAYVGGRLALDQAEAVAGLIAAQGEMEARLALAGLAGGLGRRLAPVRQGLLAVAAAVEAAIDFPEDLAELDGPGLARTLEEQALAPLATVLEERARRRVFAEGACVVLAGRPNAGKSSLFNALLGRERAIVHHLAGTTRDALEEPLLLEGLACRLVDTAGLGVGAAQGACAGLDELGRQAARQRLSQADLSLVVLDGAEPLTAEDREVLAQAAGRPRLLAVNKSDLAPAWGLEEAGLPAGAPALRVSAHTGAGLGELVAALKTALTGGQPEPPPGEALANQRQALALERALAAGQEAARLLARSDQPVELVSLELEEALLALGEVDGQGAPDEVIEEIFSKFCVGK